MNRLLLTTALLAAMAVPAAAQTLTGTITDNGTVIGTLSSTNGTLTLSLTNPDAAFSSVSLTADGAPLLPGGDLSTTTLDVKNISSGTHVLVVDIVQTGLVGVTGPTQSTFTTNNLVGAANIQATENTYANGSPLASHVFPSGTVTGDVGPISFPFGPFTSDETKYTLTFTGPGSSNDTIQLITGTIPEPSTWVMMASGFALLAGFGLTKRRNRLAVLS